MTTLTGHDAIRYAAATASALNKYADPIEGARSGLTADDERAVRIAYYDAGGQ